ncbi:hypothetical protein B5F37_11635 [Drancourtella sp. An210]|nr:hypothetical protein B5F37_11635 [Drancourtella sp. An210]
MDGEVKKYEYAEADYISGMKYKDIAEKYSVSINTVKSWKKRYNWKRGKKCAHTNMHTKTTVHTKDKTDKKEGDENRDNHSKEIPELNDKQWLFCLLYVKCFNATKAYQKAYGCKYETAMTNGAALLRKTQIREAIEKLKESRMSKEFFDEEDLFQKYLDIAYADITDYVEFGVGKVEVVTKKGEKIMIKDNYVELKDSKDVDGTLITEIRQGRTGVSVKLADKMKALQWLSEHYGYATEEQKQRVENLKKKTEKLIEETKSIRKKREDEW